jgi:hypothetical protein
MQETALRAYRMLGLQSRMIPLGDFPLGALGRVLAGAAEKPMFAVASASSCTWQSLPFWDVWGLACAASQLL